MINEQKWREITEELRPLDVTLVAVSKTKPVADIHALYDLGQRDFGENYVQELAEKAAQLPKDIRWHFIGHLQSNKVKYIAPFVQLVHAVDSFKLLQEINKQAAKNGRSLDVLLQVHIAKEETKFGMDQTDLEKLLYSYQLAIDELKNVRICGLMGMATASDDVGLVRAEFEELHGIFKNLLQSYFIGQHHFNVCSMGMSGDYQIAVEQGSTMVRIGSLLFGNR